MVEEAMRAAIDELNKRQATIDALVAALDACQNEGLPYWLEDQIDAALALARGEG